ncbi:MAG: heme NO-binding domain-containing protein [Bacteroidota bacterium]
MKGIVFTEFLDMVEDHYGYAMVDQLIQDNNLPSEGIYTSVGTYQHQEMVQLLMSLSRFTQTPPPILLNAFGKHLFGVFSKGYHHFFDKVHTAFDFLESIEEYIHVEVLKLYPDAELPRFETQRIKNQLEMIYRSDRRMADLAEGLIEASLEHFHCSATIQRENIDPKGGAVRFLITQE